MNTKKIFAGVTAVTCSVMMIGGSALPAFAATSAAELEAMIANLMAQLQDLQDQYTDLVGEEVDTPASSYDGIPDGFTFDNALYYGMDNTEVQYMQIILKDKVGAPTYPDTVGATGYFGSITKASVIEFQEMYADDILAVYGLTAGTGYVGSTTRAKLNEILADAPIVDPTDPEDPTDPTDPTDPEEPVVDGDYSVDLSNNNPAATTLMDLSAYNEMVVFDATAEDGDWDITSITVERFGISTDSNVAGLLIEDEDGVRHGNVYTFSDKSAEILFESNPISIDEGDTEEITVLYHLADGANSGTMGAKVTAINGNPVGLPLMSNTFSLAEGVNVLGTVTVDVVDVSSTTVNVDLGVEDQLLTKFKFTEGSSIEDVYIEEFTIYNNGNSDDGDTVNYELRDPNGVVLVEVESTDEQYLTFDLTNSPGYKIPNGTSKTLSLYVDVKDGATKTTQAVIENDYDVKAVGRDTETRVLATAGTDTDSSFPMGDRTTGQTGFNQITATAGTLNFLKSSDCPTGTIPAGGDDVVFAEWDVKATGEDMEVRKVDMWLSALTAPDNLDSGTTADEPDDVFTGTIRLKTSDGVTRRTWSVGDSLPATTETQYTLSSYFTVPSGTTEKLTLVGNLRTDLSGDDSFQFSLKDVYYKKLESNSFATDTDTVAANTLTGSSGTLTLVKDAAWGNKSIIAGTEVQIGQYVLQTGSTEGVYISTIGVDMSTTTGLSDIWIQKGTGDCEQSGDDVLGSVDSSPTATGNSFSVGGGLEIPTSSSQTFIVCGNFESGTATGSYISDIDVLDISGTGLVSGESINPSVLAIGQTVTIQTSGVLTVKNGANPAAQVLRAGESGIKLLDLTFGTMYEPITIDTFRFTVEKDGSQDRDFTNYTLKNGSTIQSGKSSVNGNLTFSGLSETIDYYDSETYSLWVDVNDVLTIGQDDNTRVKFASVEAIGDWSNADILESDENNYSGALTTEPGSTSSVGHYQAGDLVVSIDNGDLRPVVANTNEATNLTVTGLDLFEATLETYTATEEVSKFGALKQAPSVSAFTSDTVGDFFIFGDVASSTVIAGIVTAADEIDGTTLDIGTGDIGVELTGTGDVAASGELVIVNPVVGDFVYYYDATGDFDHYGVVTTAWSDEASSTVADTISINADDITVAAGDRIFAFDSDISQEVYSTSATYAYGVGDVVYQYDASATSSSGWGVVTTGVRVGETMASLRINETALAASDRVVRFAPTLLASNTMNMHDAEPVITASSATYSTGIIGSMQTIAVYDVEAVGDDLSMESLEITLEGSGEGQLASTANGFEIWEGGERIYQGQTLAGAAAYTCDLTTPEEIGAGETKTFTVKINTAGTWTSTQVGMSLAVKINGVKGQSGSGLDWYYTNSQGVGTVPSATSPVSITDSELPVYGKYNLTY